jgi:ubiquinone/menaquinone biosynthesis C-methylase UbiE
MDPPSIDAEAFNPFEAAGWEQVAHGYDRFFAPVALRVADALLDAADVRRGTTVLDVASGPGYVAAAAAGRGASVIGIDVASRMVDLASSMHPQIEFRRGDAERLPFDDAS